MPDQNQINDDVEIIEGKADILESQPAKPKVNSKTKAQKSPDSTSSLTRPGKKIGMMALVLLAIASGCFAVFQALTTTEKLVILQNEMKRIEQAQTAKSQEREKQMQALLSDRKADQKQITELQNQLALMIEAQSQQNAQMNDKGTAQLQSVMVMATMMWPVASDDRLILLSDLVKSLPDSQLTSDLIEIMMIAENHDIASLVRQGQEFYKQQFETDAPVIEDSGLFSSVRRWFAQAVNLQAVSGSAGSDASDLSSQDGMEGLTARYISNDLSVLYEDLKDVPSAQSWRQRVTLRLSLPQKIEQIIRQSFQNESSQP